jgi:hypothetical protein
MTTRPDSGGRTDRNQGNGLAAATLILGFLVPMAFLIGVVAFVLAATNLRRGRERLSPAARGMAVAGLSPAGMVCLLAPARLVGAGRVS